MSARGGRHVEPTRPDKCRPSVTARVSRPLEAKRPSDLFCVVWQYRPGNAQGGSVAEWLACWTQAQKARVQIAAATLSGYSLRQTAHTHRASVHQAAKLVAALLRAWWKVMAAYRRVYDSRHLQADCQEPGSAPEPYAR